MREFSPPVGEELAIDAMQQLPGYIDIGTEDFRLISHLAWRHAVEHLTGKAMQGNGRSNACKRLRQFKGVRPLLMVAV